MKRGDSEAADLSLMRRCIALAASGRSDGEYPFAAVVGRRGEFICEAFNMVRREGDVTRHAEMVALSAAQQNLRSSSLDDCTLYSTIELCAMCSYAIRESRIGTVVFGLQSPVMGGHSRWNILSDANLSSIMPEVFALPPYVLPGCFARRGAQIVSSTASARLARDREPKDIYRAGRQHRNECRQLRGATQLRRAVSELGEIPDI